MKEEGLQRLKDLAGADPSISPLVRMQEEALGASSDPQWETALSGVAEGFPPDGGPWLRGRSLRVDAGRLRSLLAGLASAAGTVEAGRLREHLEGSVAQGVALVEAAINQDGRALGGLASRTGVDPVFLSTLGTLASMPLLQAAGRRAAPLLEASVWGKGYCPVCAAWPVLSEVRGAERSRWLRCGRCGSAWSYPHTSCVYCGTHDHLKLGYLAAESERQSRRAQTCDNCRGYLKTVSVLLPLDAAALFALDVETLELDLAALDRGCSRPEGPGALLGVRVLSRTA